MTSKVFIALRVPADPARTFEAFTREISSWWQPDPLFQITPHGDGTLAFEPGNGGRLVAHLNDGGTFEIGRISAWEPGKRLVFSWRHASFSADQTTQVEVRFEPVGDETRVSIEHRGWDTIPQHHAARHGFPEHITLQRVADWWRSSLSTLHETPTMHWDDVYRRKRPDEVSWYRPHLEVSLGLIEKAAPRRDESIIDVGAGESTLVDDLMRLGYRNVTALDISSTALEVTKARLGANAKQVNWLVGDVRLLDLGQHRLDVWHDRAVFHFLTRAADRGAYVRQVARALKPGGHVIVATFGLGGPTRCSGLEIVRYDAHSLHNEFGPRFQLLEHRVELHQTPTGTTQQFTYCLLNLP